MKPDLNNPPDDSAAVHRVTYEPTQPAITRRSFRLLLILTFINTLLLGTYVLGPGLSGFAREQWAAFRQHRAERKQQQQQAAARLAMLPAQQKCLTYTPPPGTLVYAEDPEGIDRVTRAAAATGSAPLHLGTFSQILPSDFEWQTPIAAPEPSCASGMPSGVPGFGVLFHDNITGIVFLHERRATSALR